MYPGGVEPVVKLLTDAAVRKYAPEKRERRIIRDGGSRSLFLVVAPSGAKAWMMRFRTPSGRIAKIVLGPLHAGRETAGPPVIGMPLTLAGARQLAAEVHRRRSLGDDVVADHKARKHRQRTEIQERHAGTFSAAARMFIEEYAKPKTRRWFETARLLGLRPDDLQPITGGLAQRWADRPVRQIDSHDVWSLIDEAHRIGVPGITPRTPGPSEARPRAFFAALSTLFGWLLQHRKIEENPCAGLHRPIAPKSRDRVLSVDEMRLLWLACDTIGEPFGSIFRLLLLLGQRLREVAGMSNDELSDDGTTWNLPSTRTKNKKPHTVPLPPLAREIIARANPTGLLFSTNGRTPPSGWSRATKRLRQEMLKLAREEHGADAAIATFRLHDARRSVITGMAELGIRPDVIELVVNHVSGTRSGIAGVYNKSELLPERRAALERWAAHIEALVASRLENVVTLSPLKRSMT